MEQKNLGSNLTFRHAFMLGLGLGLGMSVAMLVVGGILLAILLS